MGFVAVKYVRGMFPGPAATDIGARILYWDEDWHQSLSRNQRRMVYLHEEGHLMLNTTDEETADRYAFEKYVQEGRSLKESVRSLSDVLEGAGPEETGRINARINDAMYYDWRHNKNPEAKQFLEQNNFIPMCSTCNKPGHTSDLNNLVGYSWKEGLMKIFNPVSALGDNYEKKKAAQRQNDNIIAQAQAEAIRNGAPAPSTSGNGGGTADLNKMLGNLMGAMGGGSSQYPPGTYPPPAASSNNTMLIVGVVVVVIVVAAVAFFKSKN